MYATNFHSFQRGVTETSCFPLQFSSGEYVGSKDMALQQYTSRQKISDPMENLVSFHLKMNLQRMLTYRGLNQD